MTKFSVEQIKTAPEFVVYQDLISALVEPNRLYSKQEINELLQRTLKKEVN